MIQDWVEKSFDQLCSLRKELVDPKDNNGEKYVGLEHLDAGCARIARNGTTAEVRSTKHRFYKNDVLYGKLRPYLEKAAIAQWEGVSSTDILVFTAIEGTDPEFLSFFVHQRQFTEHAVATTEGVNHPRTSWSSLSRYRQAIPLPLEQRAIASVLFKLQSAIEVQDKTIRTLKDLKAATMAKLFREGLRGEKLKETEIGEMPESWDVVSVGELFKLGSGETRPKDLSTSPTSNHPNPVYGGNGILGYSTQCITERYTIVIGRVGAYCGCVHIAPKGAWITDNALFHRNPISDRASLPFLAAILSFKELGKLQRKNAQPLVTQGIVHEVRIPLPKIEEQEHIEKVLEEHKGRIQASIRLHKIYNELFSSALHSLMTGQVRVTPLLSRIDESTNHSQK